MLKNPWLLAVLVSAATFALFSPAIAYDFINYDDNLYVFENAQVLKGLTWEGLTYVFRTLDGGSWMPLTWLSYMLDRSLFGLQPAGYHLTQIILHSASAGLLFFAVQRMTRRLWPAALVAALFAFHPQRLESVAWIAERKDVLSVFFWMLGIVAYLRYAECPNRRRMLWVLACLILGLMAKPVVVTFPIALLLLDFWPLRRLGGSAAELRAKLWPLIKEKLPLLLVCLVVGGLTIWSQENKGGISRAHFPWYHNLGLVIDNLGFYCESFFAPTGLAIVYRVEKLQFLHVAIAGLVLLVATIVVLRQAWRCPWLAVGWFWFLVTLAPVAGFFRLAQINVADRYSYLPCVGLALAVVYSAVELAARWPRVRSAVAGSLVGGLIFCALATWADLPRWQNTFSIFESAYRKSGHFIACDQLGSLLYARQEYQQSLAVCSRGLEENPSFASLYNTRGGDYYMLSDLDSALADFNRAIELNPNFSPPFYSRALVHIRRKQLAEARADLNEYLHRGGQVDFSKLPAELAGPTELVSGKSLGKPE